MNGKSTGPTRAELRDRYLTSPGGQALRIERITENSEGFAIEASTWARVVTFEVPWTRFGRLVFKVTFRRKADGVGEI